MPLPVPSEEEIYRKRLRPITKLPEPKPVVVEHDPFTDPEPYVPRRRAEPKEEEDEPKGKAGRRRKGLSGPAAGAEESNLEDQDSGKRKKTRKDKKKESSKEGGFLDSLRSKLTRGKDANKTEITEEEPKPTAGGLPLQKPKPEKAPSAPLEYRKFKKKDLSTFPNFVTEVECWMVTEGSGRLEHKGDGPVGEIPAFNHDFAGLATQSKRPVALLVLTNKKEHYIFMDKEFVTDDRLWEIVENYFEEKWKGN